MAMAAAMAVAGTARGQESLERFNRELEAIRRDTRLNTGENVPAGQRALIDYGGYLSLNYFSIDDRDGGNHGLRNMDLIGYGHVNLDGVHEFFARYRTSYYDYNTGDSFDGEGDRWEFRLERAYYRFDLQRYLNLHGNPTNNDLAIQVGRQLVYWGNGLVLSETLDGGLLDVVYGPLALQIVAGVTAPYTVDFDTSRPDFDDHTRRAFYGGLLTFNVGQHHPYAYGLIQRDYNYDETAINGPYTTQFDYNSYYLGLGSNGALSDKISYGIEATYEGGHALSNSFIQNGTTVSPVAQRHDSISAFGLDARLDYLFNDVRKTRLNLEAIVATGDRDRFHTSNTFGGNRPGTDDHSFNGFGLIDTGLAFAPPVSNLFVLRAGGSTFPFPEQRMLKRLQVGGDVFLFNKLTEQAPIDEFTKKSHYLGWEPDIFTNWQITEDVTLAVRYGLFFPGGAIAGDHNTRQSLFIGLTYAF